MSKDIVRKAFYFFRTGKFHCISQVLVLNDIVSSAFIFFPQEIMLYISGCRVKSCC